MSSRITTMGAETCVLLVILFVLAWGWIIGYTIEQSRIVSLQELLRQVGEELPEPNNMLPREEE